MRFKPSQRAAPPPTFDAGRIRKALATIDTGRLRKLLAVIGALLLAVSILASTANRTYMSTAAPDEIEAVGDHDHGSAGKKGKKGKHGKKGKKGEKGEKDTSAKDDEQRCHERPVYTRSLTVEQAAAKSPNPGTEASVGRVGPRGV